MCYFALHRYVLIYVFAMVVFVIRIIYCIHYHTQNYCKLNVMRNMKIALSTLPSYVSTAENNTIHMTLRNRIPSSSVSGCFFYHVNCSLYAVVHWRIFLLGIALGVISALLLITLLLVLSLYLHRR